MQFRALDTGSVPSALIGSRTSADPPLIRAVVHSTARLCEPGALACAAAMRFKIKASIFSRKGVFPQRFQRSTRERSRKGTYLVTYVTSVPLEIRERVLRCPAVLFLLCQVFFASVDYTCQMADYYLYLYALITCSFTRLTLAVCQAT